MRPILCLLGAFSLSLFMNSSLLAQSTENSLQLVPGTRVSLIPPPKMEQSPSFSGFQADSGQVSIMVTAIPASFEQLKVGFTEDALSSRGMELIDKQSLEGKEREALIMQIRQSQLGVTYLKYLLILEAEEETVLINGIYPEEDSAQWGMAIQEAVLSAQYDPEKNLDLLADSEFIVEHFEPQLQVTRNLARMLMFTPEGKIDPEAENQTLYMVGPSMHQALVLDQPGTTRKRLEELNFNDIQIEEENEVEVGGIPGYEIIAHGVEPDGSPRNLYLMMLYPETGGYYVMVGITNQNPEEYVPYFRKVSTSFRLKDQ